MSPFEYMSCGWALFSRCADIEGAERLYMLLKENGITPIEFLVYGENKTFLDSQAIDTSNAVAFHRGNLVGTYDAVKTYILLREPNEAAIG